MLDNTHPTWCSPARCEIMLNGSHTAEPSPVNFDPEGSGFARLRLWQRPPYTDLAGFMHAPAPLIELIAGDMDTGKRCRADLTLSQARHLSAGLVSTLIAAGDDDTHDSRKGTQR